METMVGHVAEVVLILGVSIFGLLGLFVSRHNRERYTAHDTVENDVYFEEVDDDASEAVLNRNR